MGNPKKKFWLALGGRTGAERQGVEKLRGVPDIEEIFHGHGLGGSHGIGVAAGGQAGHVHFGHQLHAALHDELLDGLKPATLSRAAPFSFTTCMSVRMQNPG